MTDLRETMLENSQKMRESINKQNESFGKTRPSVSSLSHNLIKDSVDEKKPDSNSSGGSLVQDICTAIINHWI